MNNIKWFVLLLALETNAMSVAQAAVTTTDIKGDAMYQVTITLANGVITARLENSPTVRDFVARLPMTVKLEDYAATEKVTYLTNRLTTEGAPAGIAPKVGDIAYYAPWGNIAMYYRNFGYSPGLIKLGEITHGIEHLNYNGAKQATVALLTE